MALTLRPATAEDEARLLEWRNEPTARAQSRDSDAVRPEDHHRWLSSRLKDPDTLLLVAELDGSPAGSVRFDRRGRAAEIAVTIAAEHRGRGLGREVIALGSERAAEELGVARIVAYVKPANAASLHAFAAAGFVAAGERDGMVELTRHV
jgi:RimJ/RimL family protein N-acetyltransferase